MYYLQIDNEDEEEFMYFVTMLTYLLASHVGHFDRKFTVRYEPGGMELM